MVLGWAVELVRHDVVVLVAVVVVVVEVVDVVVDVVEAEERVTVLAPWDEVTVTVEEEPLPSTFLIWKGLEYWTTLSSFSQTKRRP